MLITIIELRKNLSKYLKLSQIEDILITRNGKTISKLTNPYKDKIAIAKSLFGIIPDTITLDEARTERLIKI